VRQRRTADVAAINCAQFQLAIPNSDGAEPMWHGQNYRAVQNRTIRPLNMERRMDSIVYLVGLVVVVMVILSFLGLR
jgi:hypothetical protein